MGIIIDIDNNLLQRNISLNQVCYWLILFLVVFIPFEDFVLKFLPVSDQIYFYARFLSECMVYFAFALVVIRKLIKGIPLPRTPLDSPIIICAEIALMSIAVNNVGIAASIIGLRPVLRYVILFYLIVNLDITFAQAKTIIRYCIYAGVVQVFIGIVQFLSKGALNSFLAPRASDVEVAGATKNFVLVSSGREIGSIYGAAGDTVLYATYMILFTLFVANKIYINNRQRLHRSEIEQQRFERSIKYNNNSLSYAEKLSPKSKNIILSIISILTIVAVALTYVRACLFISTIILISYLLLKYYSRKTIGIIAIIVSILSLIISLNLGFSEQLYKADFSDNDARQEQQSIADNITGIFSQNYINVAKKQRLGALLDVPPTVIFNKPFLGYGPDEPTAIENLNNSPISFLNKEWTQQGFKDVYWVAIMTFYGVSGLTASIWTFYRLYTWSRRIYFKTNEKVVKEISLLVIALTIITVILMFFYRIMEFRIYGIYFWLFPALMFNLYSRERFNSSRLK